MPALLAPLLGWGLGVLLALLPGSVPRRRGDEAADARAVLLFAVLVYGPAFGYFLAFHGDWSYGYQLDSRIVPSAAELLLVLANAAAVGLGHRVARSLLLRQARAGTRALLLSPLLIVLLGAFALGPRLLLDATYAQVRGGYGPQSLGSGALLASLVWMTATCLAGLGAVAAAVRSGRSNRGTVDYASKRERWLGARHAGQGPPNDSVAPASRTER